MSINNREKELLNRIKFEDLLMVKRFFKNLHDIQVENEQRVRKKIFLCALKYSK
ncbi:hypothetical protein [Acinetobacter ursingii]|uniref:hypothetical protein n=1 Tax=Acinetobacter ursingii TaxID=108980 RepID=UPI00148F3D78|nr:hypothetical protein [Acinetobacter ursingii]